MGTSLSLGILISALLTSTYWLIGVALIQGYAWAWIGHFLIEKTDRRLSPILFIAFLETGKCGLKF